MNLAQKRLLPFRAADWMDCMLYAASHVQLRNGQSFSQYVGQVRDLFC